MALLSSPLPVVAGDLRPVRRQFPAGSGESSLKVFTFGRRPSRLAMCPPPNATNPEDRRGEAPGEEPIKKKKNQKGKGIGKFGNSASPSGGKLSGSWGFGGVVSEGSDIVYRFGEKLGAEVSEASEKAGNVVSETSQVVEKLEDTAEEVVSEVIEEIFGKREVPFSKAEDFVQEFSGNSGKGKEEVSAVVDDVDDIADSEQLDTFDELLEKTKSRISEAYEIVDKFNRKPGASSPEVLDNFTPTSEISDGNESVEELNPNPVVSVSEGSETVEEMLEKARAAISEASELINKFEEKSVAAVPEVSDTVITVEEKVETEVSDVSDITNTVEDKVETEVSEVSDIANIVEDKVETEVSEQRENVTPVVSGISEILDETLTELDTPKDKEKWGNVAPEDVPRDDALEDLKLCLVDTFYGTELGLSASSEVRGEILELVNQLEALNPTPAPMESAGLLNGNWILLYTAFSELLPLLAIGTVPLLKVKRISQEVDSQSLTIKNSTTISSPFATFSFSASASFEVLTPSRIQVRFREGSFEPPEISQSVDLPDSAEVFGQRVDLNPLRQALTPLQRAAAGIARAISGQPPLKLPIQGQRTQSWLVTTFLDKDLRISRGDGGLFILAREGSPLLNN